VAVRLPQAVVSGSLAIKEIWSDTGSTPIYSSPVLQEGLLYVAGGDGKLTVYDVQSKTKTETQLELCKEGGGGTGESPTVYPSIVLAGNHLFVSDDAGTTIVLAPGKQPKPLKVNRMAEGSGATPAFTGGRMFIRGGETLFCVAGK